VEGTEDEVASLVQRLDSGDDLKWGVGVQPPARRQRKTTPMALLMELVDRGFFSKPKELGSVRTALEEEGHFYPATTLSPLLLRLVRRRELRRIKDKSHWLYVR
jgi:hypothetical protein